ncbi:helix-turn-helix domain-containing protein [Acidiphilium sp. AL]|uniref:helix-turn-helix domain-containing protein n=1 Tax=Acidiphilium sp. AL TaxID=2871704 RepID=UPI0021CB4FC6|nr:helix-turn-helix domain-containing protein [Acidiphilium sp. AL]MCU4161521.1 helix-turn-helix domain-containing protein [Acidiphilium sp. AL]
MTSGADTRQHVIVQPTKPEVANGQRGMDQGSPKISGDRLDSVDTSIGISVVGPNDFAHGTVSRSPVAVFTVAEVARHFRVSPTSIYTLCGNGKLPHIRVGGQIRVRPSDLQQYEAQQCPDQNKKPHPTGSPSAASGSMSGGGRMEPGAGFRAAQRIMRKRNASSRIS